MIFLTTMKKLIVLMLMLSTLQESNCLVFCDDEDPCATANSRVPFEPEMRSENCRHSSFSDVGLTPGWYKFPDDMLDYPPERYSCGAAFPFWLNGNITIDENRVEERTVCKVGFTSTCVTQVKININNCGTFTAYCLPALQGKSERYCFGKNDSQCDAKDTTTPTVPLTSDIAFESTFNKTLDRDEKVSALEEFCSSDFINPCESLNNGKIHFLEGTGGNCKHASSYLSCHQDLEPGWYKTENPILKTCPSISSCGANNVVWMNGSEPYERDGFVKRKLCKVGIMDNKCQQTTDIIVRNCGMFTAYCLAPPTCEGRDCFGKLSMCSQSPKEKDGHAIETSNKSPFESPYITLVGIIIFVAVVCIFGIVFVKQRGNNKETAVYNKTMRIDVVEHDYDKIITAKWIPDKLPEKVINLKLEMSDEEHYVAIKDCHI